MESETKQSCKTLLHEFNAVIKAEEDQGIATAMGHKLCWEQGHGHSSQPGRKIMLPLPLTITGNSANVQEVAASDAKKVCFIYAQCYYCRLLNVTRNCQNE